MNPAAFENYLFVPDHSASLSGMIYELSETGGYSTNAFVIIPYNDPHLLKPEPRFFRIINKLHVDSLYHNGTIESGMILRSTTSREAYIEKVKQLKEHIQAGNIYEINYCIRLISDNAKIHPSLVFSKLHAIAKAPYSALVKIKDDYIISASPELFLKKTGTTLFTKPIKGTIRRGSNKEEDEALKNSLHQSIKERTENVMAVDVARNDLSQLATKGSVKVNRLYNIETFETVHQMVSTVSCELKDNTSFEKIIECTFPMASMTGAPKLRARQLIREFEDFDRNFYSGAMGIIDENGDFTLSVNIRCIFYNTVKKSISISVGGAITYLSDPEKEYEECLLKAGAMLKALNVDRDVL